MSAMMEESIERRVRMGGSNRRKGGRADTEDRRARERMRAMSMYSEGATVAQVVQELGITYRAATYYLGSMPPETQALAKGIDMATLTRVHSLSTEGGKSLAAACREVGAPPQAVRDALIKIGLRSGRPSGAASYVKPRLPSESDDPFAAEWAIDVARRIADGATGKQAESDAASEMARRAPALSAADTARLRAETEESCGAKSSLGDGMDYTSSRQRGRGTRPGRS